MPSTHIIVIEPDVELQEQIAEMLMDAGYRVEAVGSGMRALESARESVFDVVFTEMDLPDIDGGELIQRMRADDPTLVPIAMTRSTDQDIAVRALECGARSFLQKPFDADTLRLRAEKALRERKRLVDHQLLLGDLLRDRGSLRQKVAERERFLLDLIDAAPFAIISTDSEGRVLTFNGRAELLYGYSEAEIRGQQVQRLKSEEVSSPQSRTTHIRKDGQPIPVLVYRRDVRSAGGAVSGRLMVVEDLTEKESMQNQLLYAERLSLLGQLATRIAHEFKTPLQTILGWAELAEMAVRAGNTDDASQSLAHVPPAVGQLEMLINQMTKLGKPEKSRREATDLRAIAEEVLESLGGLGMIKYCDVECEVESDLPTVMGDPSAIQQVFRNLIVNAAHAMERCKTRSLTVRIVSDGGVIVASVADTGTGIEPETLERIFEPFFTTKPSGQGTGLGLPIVKTILDRHGAHLNVKSELDVGTTFEIRFPAGGCESGPPRPRNPADGYAPEVVGTRQEAAV